MIRKLMLLMLLCPLLAMGQTARRDSIRQRIHQQGAAIVHNFGEKQRAGKRNPEMKYFVGGTLVMTNSLLGDKDIDINYRKWRTRIFLGYRL